MKAHIYMSDRTHSVAVTLLTVFCDNPYVLQHFIVTGVPSFIPDDTIIATVTHFLMPEITHIATVTYEFILNWCICQAIFSDSFEIVFGS